MNKLILTGLILISCLSLVGCGLIQPQYKLTTQIIGQGKVMPQAETTYEKETLIEIQAIPEEGWEFYRWEGPITEPFQNHTQVFINRNITVKAVFVKSLEPKIKEAPGGLITWRNNGVQVKHRPNGTKDIQFIMLHAISDAMANPKDPYQIDRIANIFREYGVDSHYVIDRTGTVYQFIKDEDIANHAGLGSWENKPQFKDNMNQYSIGIELMGIGTKEEMLSVLGIQANNEVNAKDRGYTNEQYEALNGLLLYLIREYSISAKNIITHQEYDPTRKWDPGILFNWNEIDIQ